MALFDIPPAYVLFSLGMSLPAPPQDLNATLAQAFENLRANREKLAVFWRLTVVGLLLLYLLSAFNTEHVRASFPLLAPLLWGLSFLGALLAPGGCVTLLGVGLWLVSWAQANKSWLCPACHHSLHPISWRKRSPLHCIHCGVRLA